jgi:hypothetical protein
MQDFDFIGPQQSKDRPIGLRFTENGVLIGAMRFSFFPANELFKIETVADAQCRSIEDYSNATRGGDKPTTSVVCPLEEPIVRSDLHPV